MTECKDGKHLNNADSRSCYCGEYVFNDTPRERMGKGLDPNRDNPPDLGISVSDETKVDEKFGPSREDMLIAQYGKDYFSKLREIYGEEKAQSIIRGE